MPHPCLICQSFEFMLLLRGHTPQRGEKGSLGGRVILELGPAQSLAGLLTSEVISSVLDESVGYERGCLGYPELPVLLVSCHWWCQQTEEGRHMKSCCTRSFSLLSWLVLYILAFASYKGGSTAMAFGQVQRGTGGGPPLPKILTHLKEAEQQGQSTTMGKRFPYVSRMARLTWVLVGLPTPVLQHLCSLPGKKGRATGMGTRAGDICWEAYP